MTLLYKNQPDPSSIFHLRSLAHIEKATAKFCSLQRHTPLEGLMLLCLLFLATVTVDDVTGVISYHLDLPITRRIWSQMKSYQIIWSTPHPRVLLTKWSYYCCWERRLSTKYRWIYPTSDGYCFTAMDLMKAWAAVNLHDSGGLPALLAMSHYN